MNIFESLYTYKAIVSRWIDADSVILEIDQGFNQWKLNARCRLKFIDAPEKEDPLHKEAYLYVNQLAPVGSDVIIRTYKPSRLKDKWGRYLVEIWTGEPYTVSLNQDLINKGLAKVYKP